MKTVPTTDFQVNREQWKLVLNLIDSATEGVKRGNVAAALRDVAEAQAIISTWPQSSLAGHILKRINVQKRKLEQR